MLCAKLNESKDKIIDQFDFSRLNENLITIGGNQGRLIPDHFTLDFLADHNWFPLKSPSLLPWEKISNDFTFEGGVVTYKKTTTKTPEEIFDTKVAGFQEAVQDHLDSVARSWGYDHIISLCSYFNSTNATYQAEANVAVKWRDDVWQYCFVEMNKVKNGERPEPASPKEFIAELPTITRPTL